MRVYGLHVYIVTFKKMFNELWLKIRLKVIIFVTKLILNVHLTCSRTLDSKCTIAIFSKRKMCDSRRDSCKSIKPN